MFIMFYDKFISNLSAYSSLKYMNVNRSIFAANCHVLPVCHLFAFEVRERGQCSPLF